jgi:hypothetical protein
MRGAYNACCVVGHERNPESPAIGAQLPWETVDVICMAGFPPARKLRRVDNGLRKLSTGAGSVGALNGVLQTSKIERRKFNYLTRLWP